MCNQLRSFLLFFFLWTSLVYSEIILIDSDDVTQNFQKEAALNLEDNVFNVFLDTQIQNTELKTVYQSMLNKNSVAEETSCDYVKELLKGRSLKYMDENETKQYMTSSTIYGFYIFVYTVNREPEVLKAIYKKHPKYVSFITTCKAEDIFENVEDVKPNKNVFHTSPAIVSQLIVIILMLFFLIIGFYVLLNISAPKTFEEKQLIINKEH